MIRPGTYLNSSQSQFEALWRKLLGNRQSEANRIVRPAPQIYSENYEYSLLLARYLIYGIDKKRLTASALRDGRRPFANEEIGSGHFARGNAQAGSGRRIAVTSAGALSLVPEGAKEGDIMAIMKWGQTCIALRKEAMSEEWIRANAQGENLDKETIKADWRFVGECYVHGFVDGEALMTELEWEETHIW